jgi:hypothetical protein
MAFYFEFNLANRILRCRFSGPVTDEDLVGFYRTAVLLAGSLDPLTGIVDFSSVTDFQVTSSKMRELAAFPPVMPQQDRVRVIVAPSHDVFGMVRIFEIEGEATRPSLHVVRSAAEAWTIIGIQEPEFRSISEAYDSDSC